MMLKKDDLQQAIEHLQKVIRKGAMSNEYLHGALNAIREQTKTI